MTPRLSLMFSGFEIVVPLTGRRPAPGSMLLSLLSLSLSLSLSLNPGLQRAHHM
jgi:hypothetical protein